MASFGAFVLVWGLAVPGGAAEFAPLTPLPDYYHAHGLVYVDGFLYHAAGLSGTSGVMGGRKTWSAALNDGALVWNPGPDLPESTFSHATVAVGRTLYIVGGQHFRPGFGIGASNVVYYSNLNADGTPGPWTATTPLPKAAFFLNAAVWNGRIYVTGGWNGQGLLPDVYSAPVNADGTLGAWRTEIPLPEGVYTHAAAAEGTLYVLGGVVNGGSEVRSDVYRASINADGTLGPWTETTPLPVPLANLGSALANGRLYVTGGWTGSEASTTTYSAPILPDKSLGEWTAYAHFSPGRNRHATATGGGRLYVSGGVNGQPLNEVLSVELPAPPPAAAVPALVLFMPPVLNLGSQGKSVNSFIAFRPEHGNASDVVAESVAITQVNGADIVPIPAQVKGKGDGEDDGEAPSWGFSFLHAKFDRAKVSAAISDGENKLTVTGRFADGRAFEGTGRIWGKEKKPLLCKREKNLEPALPLAANAAQKPVDAAGGELRAGRSGVRLPGGALAAGVPVTVHEDPPRDDQEKTRQAEAARRKGVEAVGDAVEFGPHGTVFAKPVTLELPYERERLPPGVKESELAAHYWNAARGEWEALPSVVDSVARVVRAQTTHFSQYQVLSGGSGVAAVSDFGEVYAFPNPARPGSHPTFHVEAPGADTVAIRVYDVSGARRHEKTVTGSSPFESTWDVSGVASGVYYYVIEASGGGSSRRKTGKLAVIK